MELASQLKSNESLSAQLEAIRLNGVYTNSIIENLVEMVHKLTEEVGLLRRDNEYLRMKIEGIYTEARPRLSSSVQDSLPRWDVTSSSDLKDNVPKTYKDALSAGRGPRAAPVSAVIVPPKTAINEMHSEPTVGPGHSVSSTLLPGSSDDGFVTVARKRRIELPDSSTNSSKKLRPAMIGVRSSTSLSVVAK
jgi:hypothetical protein